MFQTTMVSRIAIVGTLILTVASSTARADLEDDLGTLEDAYWTYWSGLQAIAGNSDSCQDSCNSTMYEALYDPNIDGTEYADLDSSYSSATNYWENVQSSESAGETKYNSGMNDIADARIALGNMDETTAWAKYNSAQTKLYGTAGLKAQYDGANDFYNNCQLYFQDELEENFLIYQNN